MLGHQSCTGPGERNLLFDAVSGPAAAHSRREPAGGGASPPPSARGVAEADDDLVVVDADRVAAHAQPGVDRALAGGDLELPLVPRAADERVRRPERGTPVAQLDGGRDAPARAQRRAAVRAAVGERVQLLADAVQADA